MLRSKPEKGLYLWGMLGIAYNLYAYKLSLQGETLLPTSNPVVGSCFVSMIFILMSFRQVRPSVFNAVLPVYLCLLAYGGFLRHILYGLGVGFASIEFPLALWIALSLNGFALLCGILICIGSLRAIISR